MLLSDGRDSGTAGHAGTVIDPRAGGPPPSGPPPGGPPVSSINGFDGINAANIGFLPSPPVTVGAAGPGSFIEAVNSGIEIFNKSTGAAIAGPRPLNTFFGLSSVFASLDPLVIYDELAGKFFVSGTEIVNNKLDVAISKTSNPTTLDSSSWNFFTYTINDGTGASTIEDPRVGYNQDGYVVSFNRDDHSTTLSIRKNDMAGFVNQVPGGFSHFTLAPAAMHTSAAGDPMWFVEDGHMGRGGSTVNVVKMTNEFSSSPTFTTTTLAVNSYGDAPGPRQPGGSLGPSLATSFNFSALRTVGEQTFLVSADAVGSGGGVRARWYEFNVGGASPTVAQQGEINQGDGVDTFFPDADISAAGAIGLNFSQTSSTAPTGYLSMYVTARNLFDAAGTMQTPLLVKQGTASLNGFLFPAEGYSFTSLDPVDGTFWAANEYAAPASFAPNWFTWVANFRLALPAGPSVIAQVPATSVAGQVSSVRLTFDEPLDVSTFTPAKVVSFTGPAGHAITVSGVTAVAGSNNTQFDVSFAPQSTLGLYTMVVGPDIRDTFGHQMDQNHNGTPGEVPGDRYTATLAVQGPQVTASAAAGDHVRLTFNEPVDPTTLTPDQIVSFTGPAGAIDLSDANMTVVAGSNNTQVDVHFDPQSASGNYELTVGPAIQDTFGHQMDQDGNFIDGEVPADEYHARWTIVQPRALTDTGITHGASYLPGALSRVVEQVTFNTAMDPTTFTPDQVTINGPGGASYSADTVTPVAGSNNTRFDITFTANTTGSYTMVIGPNILDPFGNAMGPYPAIPFNVLGPKIVIASGIIPSFSYRPGALSTVQEQVSFNEAMDPTTFTPDQVVLSVGGTSYSADTVTPVGNNFFIITFTANITGRYTMAIGPNILDPFGNAMDQNGNLITGEVPGDQFTVAFNVLGPRVNFSQVLGDFTNNLYNGVRVGFDEVMDPTTFTPDQATLKGPGNVTIPITAVTPVAGTNNTQFDVSFAGQGKIGSYTLTVGPNILDTFGNAMDQNGNFITGEVPGDQFTTGFTVNGPRVTFTSPGVGSVLTEPINSLRVFFSKPIDVTTFTAAKIASFQGPGGPIGIDGIFAVPGSNFTQFDIDFRAQTATGRYTMVLGPDIRDLSGNQMDQNGNLIDGEVPGDQFTATFSLQGLRITTPGNGGNSLPGLDHVRLSFNAAVNPLTFNPGTVVSFTGPNGAVPVTGVSAVPLTDDTQFDVSFDPLGTTGSYTLVLGPTMQDLYGNKLDQNNNGIPGEDPADRYTYTFGILGPRVLASTPSGNTQGPVDHVRVTFNEAMGPSTFTPASIVSFTGPSGAIAVTGVDPVDSTDTVFDVTFAPQSALGSYTLVLSEAIQDAFGNQMDQNNNLITGENPGDRYTAQFSIALLLNGDFEDGGGSLAGWTVQNWDPNHFPGNWFVQSGTFSPQSGFPVPAPPGPTHAAMTDSYLFGPGSHVLYQDFVVPSSFSAASISFDLFIGNRNGAFFTPNSLDPNVTPNQQARVDIITTAADPFSVATADVLLNLYQTRVGDPAISGYTTHTTDLTALLSAHEGQALRLRFAEVNTQAAFQFGVDRVNLVINAGPAAPTGGSASGHLARGPAGSAVWVSVPAAGPAVTTAAGVSPPYAPVTAGQAPSAGAAGPLAAGPAAQAPPPDVQNIDQFYMAGGLGGVASLVGLGGDWADAVLVEVLKKA
jgi:hypothetical protein